MTCIIIYNIFCAAMQFLRLDASRGLQKQQQQKQSSRDGGGRSCRNDTRDAIDEISKFEESCVYLYSFLEWNAQQGMSIDKYGGPRSWKHAGIRALVCSNMESRDVSRELHDYRNIHFAGSSVEGAHPGLKWSEMGKRDVKTSSVLKGVCG